MIFKEYQKNALQSLDDFLRALAKSQSDKERIPEDLRGDFDVISRAGYDFADKPKTGMGELYPRACIKIPTGGGKTLLAVEAVRRYQENFKKKRSGLVVWMVHRESIYRQTIGKLSAKTHFYRQLLDQISGGKTLVFEKGDRIRKQDVDENLCILMIMVQSANGKEGRKVFQDSGGYVDFFPPDNRYDEHEKLIEQIPNLDVIEDNLFSRRIVKTSLGNLIRTQKALFIVDEMHRMMTDVHKKSIDGLNPAFYLGLSATPKNGTNILYEVSGRALNDEEMIKLDLHVHPPANNADWRDVVQNIKKKRDDLEDLANDYTQNHGSYIRPIALIQVERTGKDQRGTGFVHAEDMREYLQNHLQVDSGMIAVKSSTIDEIKEHSLLSPESEIRYVITKDALSEGWDCSFAYILGIVPNTTSNTGLTQLTGRVLRQPYAKKTGVKELDESYVFYTQGETHKTLDQITKGFENEGLGDLVSGVRQAGLDGEQLNPPVKSPIKKGIAANFERSLYLPQWTVKEKEEKRKFYYEVDILPRIDWESIDIQDWVQKIVGSIGSLHTVREIVVNIEGESQQGEVLEYHSGDFDVLFITRRASDIVPNPFVAHDLTKKMAGLFVEKHGRETLNRHSGYIAGEFMRFLKEYKKEQEQKIFDELIQNKTIVLSVSNDEGIGYSLPREDWIVGNHSNIYGKTLYENVDHASMNTLEREIADRLDKEESVLWWTRNKVDKKGTWYAIQGWQRDKVRPDFVVARKSDEGKLEIVYIVETKGEHLVGNADSNYKEDLFSKMNQETKNIEKLPTFLFELNDKFQFELIKQGGENQSIGRLFLRKTPRQS